LFSRVKTGNGCSLGYEVEQQFLSTINGILATRIATVASGVWFYGASLIAAFCAESYLLIRFNGCKYLFDSDHVASNVDAVVW
jgi:hypothetical protein